MASSDVSSVTKFFATANEGFNTTLGSTIVSGATSVPLNSTVGLTNGNVFVGIIEPGATAQQVFTGTVDVGGSQITNVVWTRGSNTGHAGGVTIVDYSTGTARNMTTAGILKQHTQAGAHTGITTDTISTTGNATVGGALTVTGALTTTGGLATNNTVAANNLATNAITLGYASITTNFTTTNTSAAQVTGLTVTVTVPAGGRSLKITGFAKTIYNSTADNATQMTLWDGTVGSGTQLAGVLGFQGGATGAAPGIVMAVVTPSAGSKTYNIGLHSQTAGTATLEAAATYPAFILVEVI